MRTGFRFARKRYGRVPRAESATNPYLAGRALALYSINVR
jgi:hypothetical protein